MKKTLLMIVLCVGLTDAQYKNEVVRIVATQLQPADLDDGRLYSITMVHKAIRYRNAGGTTEDTACRCFLADLYTDITGKTPNVHTIKHFINENFPGQEFE